MALKSLKNGLFLRGSGAEVRLYAHVRCLHGLQARAQICRKPFARLFHFAFAARMRYSIALTMI